MNDEEDAAEDEKENATQNLKYPDLEDSAAITRYLRAGPEYCLRYIADILTTNRTVVTSLILWDRDLVTPNGVDALKDILQYNNTVTDLTFYMCYNSTVNLFDGLLHNSTITRLEFAQSYLGDAVGVILANALRVNRSIETLVVKGVGFRTGAGVALAEAIQANSTLTTLDLSENEETGLATCIAMAEALKISKTLIQLDMDGCHVTDEGVSALAAALEINTSLQAINLACNKFGEVGGIALAKACLTNKTLLTVVLIGTKIGAAGGMAWAETLNVNQTMLTINLDGCGLENVGGEAMCEMLKFNTTLAELDLSNNYITSTAGMILADALSINTTLTCFESEANYFGIAVRAITESLKNNKTLKKLVLCDTTVSIGDVEVMIALILKNHSITELEIAGFGFITHKAHAEVTTALQQNYTLLSLTFNDYNRPMDIMEIDKQAKFLHRNRQLYLSPFWSTANHVDFPPVFTTRVFATILAAELFLPRLPQEVWLELIFPHWRFFDFF
jgi:Ran GTPase-activating protein (RanGAP) involved in mRNA processing and transport